MAIPNNNPDLLYLRSREDLLQYEDARLNALLQAMANFYTTRNDQSTWGNFLRALAIELSKIDYNYSYDLVNKDPAFLTPPDISRRWGAPLYISSNWPSPQQFDTQFKLMLVELIQAYKEGTTVDAIQKVIFAYTGINIKVQELYKEIGNGVFDQSDRNSIIVSVQVGGSGSNPLTTITSLAQLQTIVQSLYNAIDLAKPAHVGLEFTTIFGEAEQLDCILSPEFLTEEMFSSINTIPIQQSFYTVSGYVQINPAVFWLAATPQSNPWDLDTLLRDSNGNFQLATTSGKPGMGFAPAWNIASGGTTTDNAIIWRNISPHVVSTSLTANVVTVNLSFNVPLSVGTVVKLINLPTSTFLNGVPLTVTGITANSFTATFVHANYSTTNESAGTATFPFPANINMLQFGLLDSDWQLLYQKSYTNTNCQSSGINDILRIFVQQQEQPPLGPMLIQAPVLNPFPIPVNDSQVQRPPDNPKTTIAAYGRKLSPTLTPAQWAAQPMIFVNIINGMADGTNATYSYVPTTQFLHDGEIVTITQFTGSGLPLNVTAQVKNVFNLVANINGTAITGGNLLTVNAPNQFVPGMLVTLSGTQEAFLNNQTVIVTTASPIQFTAAFTHANYTNTSDTGTGEVSSFQIPTGVTVTLQAPSVVASAGLVTPILQSAYYLSAGNYLLGQAPINLTGAGIGESWVPGAAVFQGQIIVDSNGFTQLALNSGVSGSTNPTWLTTLNATTEENGVQWRNVGLNPFSAPSNWAGILNFNVIVPQGTPQPFTGEIGNWDAQHQYGLLAPRLNQVWEISGSPQDEDFIFGLF